VSIGVRQLQLPSPKPANCSPGIAADRRVRQVDVQERPAVVDLRIRFHHVVAKPEVERKTRRHPNVVLHPEGVVREASARRHLRILDHRGGVEVAEQEAGVGVAGGRQERAGGVEACGLVVAEAERREAAVGALALVRVHALRLEPEGERVPAARPLQIVLERVVVQVLGERAGVGTAPVGGRVGPGKGNLGERRIGFAGRQPRKARLLRIAPVDGRIGNRHRQPRESEGRLVHELRSHHQGVLHLRGRRNLLHQPGLGVRQRQRCLRVRAAAKGRRLTTLAMRDEHGRLLPRRQREIDLRRHVVVVEPDRQPAAEKVVLNAAAGRGRQERLEGLRLRRDSIDRNDVPRKRIAHEAGAVGIGARRRRIVDRHRQRAEVATPHRLGRNRDQHRLGFAPIAIAVVGDEEEHAIAADRPAEREAVLVLVVVRLDRTEKRAGIERLVAKELERAAAPLVRARLDDVVRRTLPVVHDRGAAGLDLELVDGLDRDAVRQVAALALHDGVGNRHAVDIGLVGEILTAHHVAPAAHRLHAGHEEHERRGVARSAGVHHQRQRRVDVVADRLPEARVGRTERGRLGADRDLRGDAANRQGHVQTDHRERIDDHTLLHDGLEAAERDRDPVLARRQR
jgi:hypothetical protein